MTIANLKNRVKETTTTTGTGAFTLSGAEIKYQTFSAAFATGDTVYYTIEHQTADEWEVGIGVYTTATTSLTRNTVLASSNNGSLVNFSAGTKTVFATLPAERTGIKIQSAQASTAGTSINFTNIPDGVKRITAMFNGVSTNGTAHILVQIGDSGGIETTGYNGATAYVAAANTSDTVNSNAGFIVFNGASANIINGCLILSLFDAMSNSWLITGHVTAGGTPIFSTGGKTLSGELDRLRITTVNGTDTFDAGSVNISYEF